MEPFSFLKRTTRTVARSVQAGFTLVEMLVVLSIITIISAVIITGQASYNQSLLLTDTAYTVAFSVRQAQFYGLSSRGIAGGAGNVVNAGYGVNFSNGSPDRYTIFGDTSNGTYGTLTSTCTVGTVNTPERKPGNCRFDSADAIVQTYVFNRGYTISKFCAKTSAGTQYCSDGRLSNLDLVFMRPNTVSVLTGSLDGSTTNTAFSCAQIHVAAPTGGAERIIRVSSLGEVSTGQTCP